MDANKVTRRAKLLAVTQETTLGSLLRLARGDRTLAEMSELSGLHLMTIQRVESGAIVLPKRETMAALARGYNIPLELLARVAYCGGLDNEPEGSDDTPLGDEAAPADDRDTWHEPARPTRRRVTASI